MGDLFVHYGKIENGSISVGQNINLEIDKIKRKNSKANHSATHLLHESLRRTLGKHVMQKGSLVSPERLRFDFSHSKPIENQEITKINKIVNDIVEGSSDVQTRIMTPKEAVSMGALALFGEKYGEEVRVVFMGKENNGFFSTELCGGTHVKNTKEVGKFKIVSQSSIASGVRRVEALRDKQLEQYERTQKQKKSLKETLIDGLKDLDGFYTFISGTKNGLAIVRDEIACKPAVVAETKDYVAIASEFQAMAHLPNVNKAKIFEPEPGLVYSWGK